MKQEIFKKVRIKKTLSFEEMRDFSELMVHKEVIEEELAEFLTILAKRGETPEEIGGLLSVMEKYMIRIGPFPDALDILGTGGDTQNTINISTATALVVSAAGVIVAKHGNRASSSSVGSADVLEALGLNLSESKENIERSIKENKFGFMFAQNFHPRFSHIAPVRKKLGIKTIFNKTFPLANPAGVKNYFLGVSDKNLIPLYREVLAGKGIKKFMIVYGKDPLDEISLSEKTIIHENINGEERKYEISPEDFGFKRCKMEEVRGGDTAMHNAEILKEIFSGKETGPKHDIVILNSAHVLKVSGLISTIEDGIKLSSEILREKRVLSLLENIIKSK